MLGCTIHQIMTSERRVAVREALANFRAFLGETDYGECERCGWSIYKTFTGKGPPSKIIVRDCKGFDSSGKPELAADCLLVKHLQVTGKLDSDQTKNS